MTEEKTITLEIFRYHPETDDEPRFQNFDVPYQEDWVILDALNWIKDNVDGTLTHRWSCRMGVCGSCGMMVDGVPRLTCAAFLQEYYPRSVKIEPLANFPVVRDLVVDMEDFMAKLKKAKPWIIRRPSVNTVCLSARPSSLVSSRITMESLSATPGTG